jgi:membrane-associated protein
MMGVSLPMGESFLWELVGEYGYLSMFLISWVIFFGFPLPNEVGAAFTGMLTTVYDFKPVYAFFSLYAGVLSCSIFGYMVGRLLGTRVVDRIQQRASVRYFYRAKIWLQKRYGLGIGFSYFVPGVRLLMPYLAGAMNVSFIQFFMVTTVALFLWSNIYFQVGRVFPTAFNEIIDYLVWTICIVGIIVILFIRRKTIQKGKKTFVSK